MIPELERLLSQDVAIDLTDRALAEVRDLRRQSQEWEAAVSLARRLAQGRLDVLRYELDRRAGTDVAAGEAATGLLFDLPDILADTVGGGRGGRAVPVVAPGPAADALVELLDAEVEPGPLCRPGEVPTIDLTDGLERLARFEQRLSATRRLLHERIDALQSEIGRRYRDGEASVEPLSG